MSAALTLEDVEILLRDAEMQLSGHARVCGNCAIRYRRCRERLRLIAAVERRTKARAKILRRLKA